MDSQGSDGIEEPENEDILFGNIIERPVRKLSGDDMLGKKKFERFVHGKSDSEDEGEMDHLDLFFKQMQEEDDVRFQKKEEIIANDAKKILWEDADINKIIGKDEEQPKKEEEKQQAKEFQEEQQK